MAKCPKCKEELPLLSKICPVCGYVVEGDENTPQAEDFADALEKCLFRIKEIPQPSFMKSMAQLSFIMLPLLAIYMLIVATISEGGLFWLLFVLFAIMAIVAIVKKASGKLGNDPFNREFRKTKNEYEYYERTAKRNFGKSKEVSKLLEEISLQISEIENSRNSNSRKNMLIWIAILAVFFCFGGLSIFSIGKAVNSTEQEPASVNENAATTTAGTAATTGEAWQQALEKFNASPLKSDAHECNNLAKEVIPVILAAGQSAKAEELFLESCMGKVGDFECAKLIVEYHNNKQDVSSAEAFIKQCAKMRYKSDQKKLQKLLTDK